MATFRSSISRLPPLAQTRSLDQRLQRQTRLHLRKAHRNLPHVSAPSAPVITPESATTVRILPQWHVILLNDDDHSYDYVIDLLQTIFGHPLETAFQMAVEVDTQDRVIVDTTSKERAELKQEQIHAFGPDWRIPRCQGAMTAIIEPADG